MTGAAFLDHGRGASAARSVGAETIAPPVVDGVEWVRPRPDARGYRGDAILAVLLAIGTGVSLVLTRSAGIWGQDGPVWASVLWAVASSLPLAFRRRWPEAIGLVVGVAYALGVVFQVAELVFSQITLFMAVYTVGAWGRSRLRAGIVRGAIVLGMFTWLFWQLIWFSAVQDHIPSLSREVEGLLSPYLSYGLIQIITNLLYFGGAWFFGDNAYRSARERAALEQRTAELAAERERSRAQAVALERVRIARELHDSVAHHVSVMGVQAGAARRVLARDPDAAAAALSAIEANARDAVEELQRLLGTLRADAEPATSGDDASSGASTLGLARIDSLIEETRATGIPIAFATVGEPHAVPPSVGLALYRIAQEALTNVRKHAGAAATVDVRLRWLAGAVELEVANTGNSPVARLGAPGSGLGQIGMRERVEALGGELELGPRSRGGYLVRARLPIRSGDPAPDPGSSAPTETAPKPTAPTEPTEATG